MTTVPLDDSRLFDHSRVIYWLSLCGREGRDTITELRIEKLKKRCSYCISEVLKERNRAVSLCWLRRGSSILKL